MKMRLGIVDDDREFCEALQKYFARQEDMEVVFVAENGAAALQKLAWHPVDVCVLDLVMPQMDGIGVLERLWHMELECYPQVIMLSALGQDVVVRRAVAMGASYYLVKPVDLPLLAKRIRQLMHRDLTETPLIRRVRRMRGDGVNGRIPARDLEIGATELLHAIGVPAHIKGYQYLRDAVTLVTQNRDLLSAVTKELYPAVAAMNHTTASRVERAIRHAIDVAWNRGCTEAAATLFGGATIQGKGKPTNAECIAILAEKLRLERKNF